MTQDFLFHCNLVHDNLHMDHTLSLCVRVLMHVEYGGHGREIAMALNISDWDGVVICSGDGLVYEVCLAAFTDIHSPCVH